MIQDIFPDRFYNEYRPDAAVKDDSPVLCFQGRKVLARIQQCNGTSSMEFPAWKQRKEGNQAISAVYAFAVNDTEYFLELCGTEQRDDMDRDDSLFETEEPISGQDYAYVDIRHIRQALPNVYGMIVFSGYHLHMWYSGRRFCGACGHATIHDTRERAVCCPACKSKNYPRIMPAVIVGVTDGDRLLVTKYKEGYRYYALIAGFTEIGETLEETVSREVREETGLRVTNIRYYKSQPWGIAGDILAGFYCDVEGDRSIRLDGQELKTAEWKSRHEIELQLNQYSLTNEMMQRFKEGNAC